MKKPILYILFAIVLMSFGNNVFAQLPPNISYSTPQVYAKGSLITPLVPTNTGNSVPANIYGTVSTLAGKQGTTGQTNATGTAATFNGPETMVGDASGNLYVCDVYNNAIRQVTPAGVVTTFAGSTSGTMGFHNATGTAATFYYPNAIAIDAGGNFYVADYGNGAVRKITSAGVVTTFASGLNQPAGLAFNSAATILYVSEQGGNDVKQITLAGVVSAYAGSGVAGSSDGTSLTTAQFNNVVDLNADNAGNLFIMDYGNNLIREVSGTTNLVSTFAGGITAGYVNATGTSARFNGPYGMVIDGANNIYIGDNLNNNIRMVTSTGVVTLFAGSASKTAGHADGTLTTATFNQPEDMYINSTTGLMYLADNGNNTIRQIAISGYTISPVTLPTGLSFDANTGTISGTPTVTTAATTYTITAYNYWGSSTTTVNIQVTNQPVISYATPQSYPAGTTIPTLSPSSTGGAIPATTYSTVSALLTSGTVNKPRGITTDGATGNIYEADFGGNVIKKITSGGVATVFAGTGAAAEFDANGTSAKFNGPTGIVYDGSAFLYVVDNGGNTIRRISTTTPFTVTTIAGLSGTAAEVDNPTGISARFNSPYGIDYDGAGNLYVTDFAGNSVRKISTTSPYAVTTIASAGFNGPAGIAYDGSSNVYVANANGNTILQVTTGSGTVSTFAGSGSPGSANGTGGTASFKTPYGVTFDATGNLIIADEGNNLIRTITPAAVVTTLAGSGATGETNGVAGTAASFTAPYCVNADILGNAFVGDNATTSTVRKILLTGYTISPTLPGALAFDVTTGKITGKPTAGVSSPATDYTITAYNASGSSSAVVNITVYQGKTWISTGSTVWTTAANWSGGVPGPADQANIGLSPFTATPTITASTSVGSIVMNTSGGTAPALAVNGATLTVSGDITYQNTNATPYTAVISGTGAVSATNLNIVNSVSGNTYTETLTSSVTNLTLSGNLTLKTTYNSASKIENANFNFTGGTMTLSGITTTNANASNISTISLSPTSSLNFTGATAFSGLSATGKNALTISSPTIGYTGFNNQTVYNSTAIANTTPSTSISYTNIVFDGSGIKTALSGNLNIAGNFTNNLISDGVSTYVDLSTNSPNVNFTGSSAQTLTDAGGVGGTGTTFKNVNMSGGNTVTLASGGLYSISSSGLITLSGSTTLAAGTALLTLNSDATGSAGVATIPTGSSITGTVYAQRFVTGGVATLYRGYRNMTSPVSSTGTTGGLIDMSYVPASTFVTGGVAGALCTTCVIGGNPSLFLYNETVPVNNTTSVSGNFQGVVDINATSLSILSGFPAAITTGKSLPAGEGFYLYFRGDKVTNILNKTTPPYAAADNVTFTSLGVLNQGPITVKDWYNQGLSTLSFTAATGATAQSFHLVGNPYANSIDWHKAFSGTLTSGIYAHLIDQTIYVYNVTSKIYSTYMNTSATAGTASGPPGGSNIIPSGQGFFVHANATGAQLTFNEDSKVSTEPAILLLNAASPGLALADKHIRIQLYKDPINIDESVVIFNQNSSSNFVTGEDALYLKGSGVISLSNTSTNNKALAISQLPFTKTVQTIPLNINVASSGTYQLNMTEVINIPNLFDVWLKDAYMKDSLDIKHNPNYSFIANTSDTTTFGTKRFSIVIRQNLAYAYHLLSFNGAEVKGGAQLTWTTENEDTYTTFVVQRSTDGGKTFTTLSTITSNNGSTYSYLDTSPAAGQNHYRLQITDVNGVITYSNVVLLLYPTTGSNAISKGNISIYPDPVKDVINLAITSTNNAAATYAISIITSNGDLIRSYTSPQATWQNNISDLRPGVYVIKVVNNANKAVIGTSKFIKL